MARALGGVALLLAHASIGCGTSKYAVKSPPAEPFDAVILPGCPTEDDGSPSRCQIGHAGHAALLWRAGWARFFIVSGSDVHSPYVEAESTAQAMTVLGVPPDRIILEVDALHSDENIYYSVLLAERERLDRLAVASIGSVAGLLCKMMEKWGHECSAIAMDTGALEAFLPPYEAELHALRARKSEPWEALGEREARIAKVNGYGRPPSFFLYLLYGWLGRAHRPIAPAHPEVVTWGDRLREVR